MESESSLASRRRDLDPWVSSRSPEDPPAAPVLGASPSQSLMFVACSDSGRHAANPTEQKVATGFSAGVLYRQCSVLSGPPWGWQAGVQNLSPLTKGLKCPLPPANLRARGHPPLGCKTWAEHGPPLFKKLRAAGRDLGVLPKPLGGQIWPRCPSAQLGDGRPPSEGRGRFQGKAGTPVLTY